MCYHHQPQQIINENTIPSHGSVFQPRPFNVLCFYYAKLALVYILFVRTQRGHFMSILPKMTRQREKGILSQKNHRLATFQPEIAQDKAMSVLPIASRWISGNNCPIKLSIYYHLERELGLPHSPHPSHHTNSR